MNFILNFMKVCQLVQKLLEGAQTHGFDVIIHYKELG
jgi:hypothetical protein